MSDKPGGEDEREQRVVRAKRARNKYGARYLLPERGTQDSDQGWGDDPSHNDEWLKNEKPPHW